MYQHYRNQKWSVIVLLLLAKYAVTAPPGFSFFNDQGNEGSFPRFGQQVLNDFKRNFDQVSNLAFQLPNAFNLGNLAIPGFPNVEGMAGEAVQGSYGIFNSTVGEIRKLSGFTNSQNPIMENGFSIQADTNNGNTLRIGNNKTKDD